MDNKDYYVLRLYLASEVSEVHKLMELSKGANQSKDFSEFFTYYDQLRAKYASQIASIKLDSNTIKLFECYKGLEEIELSKRTKEKLKDFSDQNRN